MVLMLLIIIFIVIERGNSPYLILIIVIEGDSAPNLIIVIIVLGDNSPDLIFVIVGTGSTTPELIIFVVVVGTTSHVRRQYAIQCSYCSVYVGRHCAGIPALMVVFVVLRVNENILSFAIHLI